MNNTTGEIRVCPRCGKMFCYMGIDKAICNKCKEEDEAEFNKVKEYVYNNSDATIMQVSKDTGVRVNRIKTYLREGRLMIPESSPIFLNCELCGTSIRYGRYCRECAESLSSEMKKELHIDEYQIGEKPKNGLPKLRFSDQ
ncbi:MerR family transcriptional regulator [Anaeromicropila herbilytica]|uniref:MerR family transcriptional regulator n=1 Tax=Anaeromicropila herbilytica TaxID=2785025 RepID=A0A7R7IBK6_9FIRM|nr:MerR family transcriptional regulator [Anaeromicropila herbilytica]BCN29707.1 hypothetical protein bsdtb5_10020 [Anaeromicropila herbilytica]